MVNLPQPQVPGSVNVRVPDINVPDVQIPDITIPDIRLGDFELGNFDRFIDKPAEDPFFDRSRSVLDLPENLIKDFQLLTSGIFQAGISLVQSAVDDPIGTIEGAPEFAREVIDLTIDDYRRLFTDPAGELVERPLFTSLNILPVAGIVQKLGARAGIKSIERVGRVGTKVFDPFVFTGIKPGLNLFKRTPFGQKMVQEVANNTKRGVIRAGLTEQLTRFVDDLGEDFAKMTPDEANTFFMQSFLGEEGFKTFLNRDSMFNPTLVRDTLEDTARRAGFDSLDNMRDFVKSQSDQQLLDLSRTGRMEFAESMLSKRKFEQYRRLFNERTSIIDDAKARNTVLTQKQVDRIAVIEDRLSNILPVDPVRGVQGSLKFSPTGEPGFAKHLTFDDVASIETSLQQIDDYRVALEVVDDPKFKAAVEGIDEGIAAPTTGRGQLRLSDVDDVQRLQEIVLTRTGFNSFPELKQFLLSQEVVVQELLDFANKRRAASATQLPLPTIQELARMDVNQFIELMSEMDPQRFAVQPDLFAFQGRIPVQEAKKVQRAIEAMKLAKKMQGVVERRGNLGDFIARQARKGKAPETQLRGLERNVRKQFGISLGEAPGQALKDLRVRTQNEFLFENLEEIGRQLDDLTLAEGMMRAKWNPEGLVITDAVKDSISRWREASERFAVPLRRTGQLDETIETLRKRTAFQAATNMSDEAYDLLRDRGLIVEDEMFYVPQYGDKRFFEAVFGKDTPAYQKFVNKVLGEKPMTVEITSAELLKNPALKPFRGRLQEEFVKFYANEGRLQSLLESHGARQANFLAQQNTLTSIIDDSVASGRTKVVRPENVQVNAQTGALEVFDDAGNLLPENKFVFVPRDSVFQQTQMMLEYEGRFLDGLARGQNVDDIITGIVDELQPEKAVKVDPQALIHMRDVADKRVFAMPRVDFDAMVNTMGWKTSERMGISLAYGSLINAWRSLTLKMTPRWMINNAVGNAILAFMGGVSPADFRFWFKHRGKMADMLPTVRQGGIVQREIMGTQKALSIRDRASFPERIVRTTGVKDPVVEAGRQFIADNLPESMKPIARGLKKTGEVATLPFRKLMDLIANGNVEVESVFRELVAAKGVRDIAKRRMKERVTAARTLEYAAAEVLEDLRVLPDGTMSKEAVEVTKAMNDILFDYSAMSSFEKSVMRRVFPFWSWHRNIFNTAINLPANAPLKMQILAQLGEAGSPEIADDLPDWLRGAALVGYTDDGNALFVSMRGANPYFDALNILEAVPGVSEDFSRPAAMMNPFIKVGIEQISGKDIFRNRPFRSNDTWTAFNGKTYRWDEQTGDVVETVPRPDLLTHVINQVPLGTILGDAIAEIQGIRGLRSETASIFAPEPIVDKFGRQIVFGEDSQALRRLTAAGTGGNVFEIDLRSVEKSQRKLIKQAREEALKRRRLLDQELKRRRKNR